MEKFKNTFARFMKFFLCNLLKFSRLISLLNIFSIHFLHFIQISIIFHASLPIVRMTYIYNICFSDDGRARQQSDGNFGFSMGESIDWK